MSRRRLQVVTSSDEEDDLQQQRTQNHSQPPQQFGIGQRQADDGEEIEVQYEDPLPDIETVALGSTSGLIQPQLISDDDEDFIDVPDHFTPPSPPLPQQPHMPSFENSVPASATPSSNGPSQCPVTGVFRGLGLNLRNEWLESCIRGLETAVPGFSGLDSGTKAKFCFEQFLNSDMNFIGGGVLPLNVDSMHLFELAGPFVLQVDEIVNLSCPLRERYHNSTAGPKRCLKLSMTDGIQRVFGMEYRPINDLQVLAFAGFKVAIKNVVVRRGLLMLVPEVLEVLGGSVQELEAARQSLVFEINKPPRGKRTRQGVLPPLAARATLAAWPQTVSDNLVQSNTSAQHSNNSTHQDVQGARINANNPVQNNTLPQQYNNSTRQDVQGAGINTNDTVRNNTFAQHSNNLTRQDMQGSAPSGSGINTPRTTADSVVAPPSSIDVDELPLTRDTTDHTSTRESTVLSTSGMAAEDNIGSTVQDVEDVEMADPPICPYMLSGDRELPFTYLNILSLKLASMSGKESEVRGKIKCFVTDVSGFDYRERDTYDLRVFVDDGSLISKVLVHHDVVQKLIGYSPRELTAALASPDMEIVTNIKKILVNFKNFLVNFEGYILIEINKKTPEQPIAIEMTQGCPSSDAVSLLNRCLSSYSHLDPIIFSP